MIISSGKMFWPCAWALILAAATNGEIALVSPHSDQHFPQRDALIKWEGTMQAGFIISIFIDGVNMHNSTQSPGEFKPGSLAVGMHQAALVSSRTPTWVSDAEGTRFVLDEQPKIRNWGDAKEIGTDMSGMTPDQIEHVTVIRNLVADPPEYPVGKYEGRGIVICAGGRDLFANAFIAIKALRNLGCELPIEVFYQGPDEMTAETAELLAQLEVMIVDTNWFPELQDKYLRGWQIKAAAIMHSSFEEVIAIDADNIPLHDPKIIFETEQYKETGNLYWRDFSTDPHWIKADFFGLFGVTLQENEPELEAGQVAIHKRRCWVALVLYSYINANWLFFYRNMYGDKDTHRLAYKIAKMKFSVVQQHPESLGRFVEGGNGPRFCGDSMLHFLTVTSDGIDKTVPMFIHRTLSDFSVKEETGHLVRSHHKPPLTLHNATVGYRGWDVRTVPLKNDEGQYIEQWCVITPLDIKTRPVPHSIARLEQLTLEWAEFLESRDILLGLPGDAKGRG